MPEIDISIVIVNYNVKDYLSSCLDSIRVSQSKHPLLNLQIIVVDNASIDGSDTEIPKNYPNIEYYYLPENLGFGKANNVGIEKCKGKYTLLLNPDTIVFEDTLPTMLRRMNEDNSIWAAGCRVLNTDGTFQLACRRGFPTLWNSFTKLSGLQSVFPNSKVFAGYNKNYLDDREEYDIDAIIGAFMFFRTDKLKQLEGFDPDFYMYGEDIDLCKRVWDNGGRIRYIPETEIIHHKGESTKRSDINGLYHFYEAMKIYASKHTSNSAIFLLLLSFAIKIRSGIAFLIDNKKDIGLFLIDSIILFLSAIISTKYIKGEFFNFPEWAYPDVFIVLILVHFLSFFTLGIYFESRLSAAKAIPAVLFTFLGLSSLTYYFNQYAFSRGVILLTILIGGSIMIIYRLLAKRNFRNDELQSRLLIENSDEAQSLISYLRSRKISFDYYNADSETLKYSNRSLIIGIQPDANYTYSEYLSELLLGNGNTSGIKKFNISLPRYRFFKRIFDVIVSILCLTIFIPFTLIKGRVRDIYDVFKGKKSIVGVIPNENHKFAFKKKGIVDISKAFRLEKLDSETIHQLNMKYLQDYTLIKDIELIFQTLLNRK